MNQDHEHHHKFGIGHHDLHLHPGDRAASRKALIGALAILVVFLGVEFVGGLLTNSLALLSDAAHLLTDVVAVALALVAQRLSVVPPSAKRSFGYRRLEIVAALINGLTLWVVAIFICVEAVERFYDEPEIRGGLMVGIAAAGFVAQALAAFVLSRASGESLNVKGAYIHALTDAVQSLGVIAAAVVIIATGYTLVDPIVSILIALLIVWSGGRIVVEAIHVLLEGTPPEVDLGRLARAIGETKGVHHVSDLHAWSLTTGYNALSAHVVGDEGLDATGREELARSLSELIREEFAIHHVTLQVEPKCGIADGAHCGDWLDSCACDEDGTRGDA
ncbi:MAG: cation transporter [Deltaproteobacteria bacterium]|nr:cation transporter [Deltaproteobacteria bacterium]